MVRFCLFAICLASIFAGNFVNCYKIFSYTFGERVDGDLLISKYSNYGSWYKPTNATHEVIFPKSGETNNATISFINVEARHVDTGENGCRIWAGGIGQKSTELSVFGNHLFSLRTDVYIYGY